jgi:zinc protease
VKGQSGLAHLFEHILFRHKLDGVEGGYDAAITKMGAFNNASTNQDITFYIPLTFSSNLEELARLEAARFTGLDFGEKIFRTEAGAVLGEYRRNAANPGLGVSEVQNRLLYGDYGYGHTTIGYLEDVQDMPNEFQAALKFYGDWYRPNNAVLIVAGDVKPDSVFKLAEKLYGKWQQKPLPALPEAQPVGGPKRENVDWPADVQPRVNVAYRIAPFRSDDIEAAVAFLMPDLLTGPTSTLFQELRFKKKVASSVASGAGTTFGPGAYTIFAQLFTAKFNEQGTALLDSTMNSIVAATDQMKSFSQRPDATKLLEELRSRFGYDLLSGLNSPANAAGTFATFYRFERDPKVFDKLIATMRRVTPADVDKFAQKYFVPENRVVVTLTHPKSK